MNKTVLQHYGILGQKWGVRRKIGPNGLIKKSNGKISSKKESEESFEDISEMPPQKRKAFKEYVKREFGPLDNIDDPELVALLIMEFNELEKKVHHMALDNALKHFGIVGQKWGVRRFQNRDGTLTPKGQSRLDKKDNKWAQTKGEKIKNKLQKTVSKDMNEFVRTQLELSYTPNGKLSSKTILAYNNRLASLMNERSNNIPAPSGRVLRFVAKRGEIGVHTAVADAGYDIGQLKRGVFKTGKVAYKEENLMKGG